MDDYEEYEDDTCPTCGRNLNEAVSGCPDCNSCGGLYSPGTEECDFCEYSEGCARLWASHPMFKQTSSNRTGAEVDVVKHYKVLALIEYEYMVESENEEEARIAVVEGNPDYVIAEREIGLKEITLVQEQI